jgi:UPF0755 protein
MRDHKNYTYIGVGMVVLLCWAAYLYYELFSIPKNFPVGKSFTVNENESLKSISERLEEEGYIYSPLLFRAGISFLGKDRAIQLGGYMFDTPHTLFSLVSEFVQGRPSSPLLSVTIPEGSTSFEVALLVAKALPSISLDRFDEVVSKNEANGKLFPSTYYLLPSYKEEDIVKLMLTTYQKKISSLIGASKITYPLSSEHDVVVLASILEGEGKTKEDMQKIAGILLTRLTSEMPLQVDVAKETYKKRGLPSAPINNPGVLAINAVLHPVVTPYLYYITGNDGNMYYAKTFAEHKRNIQKYLR